MMNVNGEYFPTALSSLNDSPRWMPRPDGRGSFL